MLFPCVVVKNSDYTVLNICEEMMSVCFNTDSGIATTLVLGFCLYQYEVGGVW